MIPRLGSRDGFSRQYSLDRRDRHIDDVAEVGGRNALLGELYLVLSAQGVNVPNGFALTAAGYREALIAAGAISRS